MIKKFPVLFGFLDSSAGALGSKAANLAKIERVGLLVPPSLIIRPADFDKWLATLGRHKDAVAEWRRWEGNKYPEALKELHEEILQQAPSIGWHKVYNRVQALLNTPGTQIIVRSNIVDSRMNSRSLAGLSRAIIVANPDSLNLWSALTTIIASGFCESAARQHLESGSDPLDFCQGILLQVFVKSKISGTSYSRHPKKMFHRPPNSDAVYNPRPSSFGLSTWVVGSSRPSAWHSMSQAPSVTFHEDRAEEAIPTALMPFWYELRDATIRAEESIGGPAELEWIYDGKIFWIVKVQAIAGRIAELAGVTLANHSWCRQDSAERFPNALSDFSWSFFKNTSRLQQLTFTSEFGLSPIAKSAYRVSLDGYVYSDPEFLSSLRQVKASIRHYLPRCKEVFATKFRVFSDYIQRRIRRLDPSYCYSILKLELLMAVVAPVGQRLIAKWNHFKHHELRRLTDFADRSAAAQLSPCSDEILIGFLGEIQELSASFFKYGLVVHFIRKTIFHTLGDLWHVLKLDPAVYPDLYYSGKETKALHLNDEVQKLCRSLRKDSEAMNFFDRLSLSNDREMALAAGECLELRNRQSWQNFLDNHGHFCATWEISKYSWGESPSQLAPMLYALTTAAEQPRQRPSETRCSLDIQLAQFTERDAALLPLVRKSIELVDSMMTLDDDQHAISGKFILPMKPLLRLAAESLVSKHLVEKASDCYNLSIDEILKALKGNPTYLGLLAEKRQRISKLGISSIPRSIPDSQSLELTTLTKDLGPLCGRPMSQGIAQGVVCVVHSLEEARAVIPGCIILVQAASPAIVPLYPMISGLLTCTGARLSPGIIAARASAIPVISDLNFQDLAKFAGKRVYMNGTTGEVILIEKSAAIEQRLN